MGAQGTLSEGAFVDGDKTKLDGIEAGADVTDAANVTAAGAVMNTGDETIAGAKEFSTIITGNITGNAATASVASKATALNTITNGIVKTTNGDGTLSIGNLVSGDIPDNSANTSGNAATASVASTVTITDSDANTNFPVVFNNESDALLDDTGTFTYNPSSGTVTATSFVGSLSGNATGSSGSCTGNAATASQLASTVNIGGASFNGSASISIQLETQTSGAEPVSNPSDGTMIFDTNNNRIYIYNSTNGDGSGGAGWRYITTH